MEKDVSDRIKAFIEKKRGIIVSKKNVDKETLINEIKSNTQYNKYLENKKIVRNIYVKDKLINLILE